MSVRKKLRAIMAGKRLVLFPGAYDALSARIIEAEGFEAICAGGYAAIGSMLAQADMGQSNMRDYADHYARICAAVDIPVYVDADTGFGGVNNVRQMVRAFEAAGVVLGEGTVSPLNGKAVRAAAGSLFRLPVVKVKIAEALGQLRERGIRRLATAAHKGTPLPEAVMTGSLAIFLGGEGAGLGGDLMRNLEEVVTIPHAARVESLNAGVAGSLLLYEAWRQRKAT